MVNYYSHALFQSSNLLRSIALDVDRKENGGNNNGLIDGNEIQLFKDKVKKQYNYDFDFSQLNTIKTKKINVRDAKTREAYYKTTTEIAQKFGGVTTTKTIDWLNGKQPKKDLLTYSTISILIPYMDDYEKCVEIVNQQEKEAVKRKEAKDKEELELDKRYHQKHWIRSMIGITREEYEKHHKRDY